MNKYLKTIAFCAIVTALSSCLKDKAYDSAETGLNVSSNSLIQLGGGNNSARSQSVALDFKDSVVTPTFVIARLLSPNPGPTDIIITLDTTGQSVQFPAGVVKLPNSFYTLPKGLTITIPAGQNEGTLQISTNAIQFDPSTTYALAFKIASVSPAGYPIAQNFSTFYTTIGAKNDYDGRYRLKGIHNRPGFQFPYDQEMHMITTGASSVIFYWPKVAAVGHPIGTGPDIVNDVSWYGGGIAPLVVFNPVTNLVSQVYNNAGGTVIDIYTGPGSGVGRFEPGSKTMYVYWRYNMNNARAFMDTLYYLGPR